MDSLQSIIVSFSLIPSTASLSHRQLIDDTRLALIYVSSIAMFYESGLKRVKRKGMINFVREK